ncbi:hypothetical protein Mal35_02020 [Gimesia maris]|uniref:hypothetical protein n=1 Tax=Gimesia maris TaxID=122 RepID=UPI001188F94F|nr:hypothetical protein [Gimesia maris]QDT76781.1 hypothetical protein Mal35_02020 [Gimesia maris]
MKIAFGPEMPEFPYWQWIGQDLAEELQAMAETTVFQHEIPACDAVVFMKFMPDASALSRIRQRSRVFFCPVDIYGSAAEIDADWKALRQCDCVISHAPSLSKYFASYTRVKSLDHHLKFTISPQPGHKTSGPLLWTGNAGNLPPLVEWVNQYSLPEELWILTNLPHPAAGATDLGFHAARKVRVADWSPARHREWLGLARVALDIKGTDFRSRHKPVTKAHDFIASGIPLAMNANSSPAIELAKRGFSIANPDDLDFWFSKEYWQKKTGICPKTEFRSFPARDGE